MTEESFDAHTYILTRHKLDSTVRMCNNVNPNHSLFLRLELQHWGTVSVNNHHFHQDPEYAAPADDAECWRGCKQSFSSWGNTVVPPMQSVPFNPMEVGAHMGLYSPTGTGFPMYSGMQAHDIGFGPAGFMAEAMSAGRRESVVGSQYLASRPVRFSNLWNSPMSGSPVDRSQYGVMPTVGQQYAQPQQAHMVHSPAYQIPSPAQYTRPHGLGLYPGDARASNPDPMDEFGTSYSQPKNNSHSKVHSRQPYWEATQPGTG